MFEQWEYIRVILTLILFLLVLLITISFVTLMYLAHNLS